MRTYCSILAIALMLELGWATGLYAAPTEKAAAPQLSELIAKLGSKKFLERDSATRTLAELGPMALDALRKALQSPDAEVRRRADSLIQTIERRIETAKFIAPKHVHLVYKDVLVLEAVADFANHTKFPIVLNDADRVKLANRKITLDTGDTSFWQAFDQFCQKAGLVEHNAVGATLPAGGSMVDARGNQIILMKQWEMATDHVHDPRLVLTDGKSPALPTCYAGALRVRKATAGSQPGHASEGEALCYLEVLPEPRMAWKGILDVQINKAVDEHGQALEPAPGNSSVALDTAWQLGAGNFIQARRNMLIAMDASGQAAINNQRQIPIRLKLADKPAKMLKELHGTIACQVQTTEPLASVENILKAAGHSVKTKAGGSLKVLESTREDSGLIRIRVQLDLPGQGLFLGQRGMRFNRRIMVFNGNVVHPGTSTATGLALLDAKGNQLRLVNTEPQIVGNANGWCQEYRLTYQPLEGQGDPVKFVYTGPRIVTLEVPFTLKDVPLP
jgi:hypothetical protein